MFIIMYCISGPQEANGLGEKPSAYKTDTKQVQVAAVSPCSTGGSIRAHLTLPLGIHREILGMLDSVTVTLPLSPAEGLGHISAQVFEADVMCARGRGSADGVGRGSAQRPGQD